MNKIYRLKFDKRRNELVVVSEITAGTGKEKSTGHIAELAALSPFRKLLGTLTPLALLTGLIISLFPGMALAADLPAGGQIVGGQGSISTSGNQMTIYQQTQNMVTNWHSFDVGKNNTVQFVQPDSSSVALNRVTGTSGSQIMGTLKANGQVFILNPNGVLFGKDARVNVAGLVASTKNISNADFMKGQYTLSGSGNPGAQVVNQGSLTTSKGGYIVLAGERVSNSGTVTTSGGKTVLAAGKTVTLQLDNGGLTSVSVNGNVVNALVENRGLISATDGQVYLTAKGQNMLLNTVVNNSGTIEAKGLASRGGEIVLSGGDSGVVSQSGHLLADSSTGQGGKVILEGQNIHLAGSSLTSATGRASGGEVYVGGGWQGKDSNIRNASKVVMDKAATVDVSATEAGNGGTAVLWSDDYTNFRGNILARGGDVAGNGGRVETSSLGNLQAFGDVDASARAGTGGEWLLDPFNIDIVHGNTDTDIEEVTGNNGIFIPDASGSQVSDNTIVSRLNNGTSVTIKTSRPDGTGDSTQKGDIVVKNDVNISKITGGDASLVLLADNNIQLGNDVNGKTVTNITIKNADTTGKKLNLKLQAGSKTSDGSAIVLLGKATQISLNGGDFIVGGNNISFLALHGDNSNITAGNILINATGNQGVRTAGLNLNATVGNLTINASNVTSTSSWGFNVSWMASKQLSVTSAGNVSLLASDTTHSGGNTMLSGKEGVTVTAGSGDIMLDGTGNKNNTSNSSVELTSTDGDVSLQAVNGSVQLSGSVVNGKPTVGVAADKGNITISGSKAVRVTKANINASTNNININGKSKTGPGVTFKGVTLSAVTANISGETSGNQGNTFQSGGIGGVSIGGTMDILKGNVNISGVSNNQASGVVFADLYNLNVSNLSVLNVKGETKVTNDPWGYASGVVFDDSYIGATTVNNQGNINIVGISSVSTGVNFGLYNQFSPHAQLTYHVNGTGHINITGSSSGGNGVAVAASIITNNDLIIKGVSDTAKGAIISGAVTNAKNSSVNISGETNKGIAGVEIINGNLSSFDGSVSSFVVNGQSNGNGGGVVVNGKYHENISGIIVNASSENGNGFIAGNESTIKNSTITAKSNKGYGINIVGDNVSVTGGVLNGTSQSGSGIILNGGKKYTLDSVSVSGHSVNGSGVVVNGTLNINNGTKLSG
ncbi:filamentous hemagglutinin N-terminal domain-containing protein, partial [Salmonella enterica subsp. enterica]|nr:filamentous hemagglutinin N-terminal domain-containing protein [Salmonella enterica subsp. enterica serovar Oranienburg]MIP06811.1 filamentous hemagglutinin N-terminal domain-containing protein [Salmonella enterica subsp. enterica serovar Oranienburg]